MTIANIAIPEGEVHLLLHDVPWELYVQLREELDTSHRRLRLVYDEGALEIMSPHTPHEKWKNRIGRLIELMALELDLTVEPLGSTTFRNQQRRRGIEPDECYYV